MAKRRRNNGAVMASASTAFTAGYGELRMARTSQTTMSSTTSMPATSGSTDDASERWLNGRR